MASLGGLRERFGRAYVSRIGDIDVPWRSLTIGEYIKYSADGALGIVPEHVLQEELFRKCVLDATLVNNYSLKAGIVPTVATHIMAHSGPATPDEFHEHLTLARAAITKPLYQLISLICQAFPGYSPSEVEQLEYPEFMIRLAQAEEILLKARVLSAPLALEGKRPPKKHLGPGAHSQLKALWKDQEKIPPPGPKKGSISSEEILRSNLEEGTFSSADREKLKQDAWAAHEDFFKKQAASQPPPSPPTGKRKKRRGVR